MQLPPPTSPLLLHRRSALVRLGDLSLSYRLNTFLPLSGLLATNFLHGACAAVATPHNPVGPCATTASDRHSPAGLCSAAGPPQPRSHPRGFEESMIGCCGTGKLELSILCNTVTSYMCSNDGKYVFWDSVHPTEKVVTVAEFHGAFNVIPDSVTIGGTFRAFSEDNFTRLKQRIEELRSRQKFHSAAYNQMAYVFC